MVIRKCSELKKDEQVVFNIYNDIYKRKIPMDGNVIYIDKVQRTVAVCYLYGYKCEYAHISYDDMIAVYNPNGVFATFDNISGKSDLLEAV